MTKFSPDVEKVPPDKDGPEIAIDAVEELQGNYDQLGLVLMEATETVAYAMGYSLVFVEKYSESLLDLIIAPVAEDAVDDAGAMVGAESLLYLLTLGKQGPLRLLKLFCLMGWVLPYSEAYLEGRKNSLTAVLKVQLYAEVFKTEVEVVDTKSALSSEEASIYEVTYLLGGFSFDYDYLNTESDKTQFARFSVMS